MFKVEYSWGDWDEFDSVLFNILQWLKFGEGGVVNMAMGFVNSFQALVGLRVLLGIFEAGVMPGIIYLTSMYYKRHEFQKRMSFFFSSTLLSSAIGSLLAYGIAHLGGKNGYRAWRWIFIIEGVITAFLSVCACFLIVDWPDRNRYLTAEKH